MNPPPTLAFIHISLFMSRKIGFHRIPGWETVIYIEVQKAFPGKALGYLASLMSYPPSTHPTAISNSLIFPQTHVLEGQAVK